MSICNANPEIWRQLQPRQKDEIYDVSLRILREIGVRVGSASVRKRLCSNGARVCGEIVYITDEMVSSALKTSPSVFKIYRTTGEDAMLLDGRSVYFGESITNSV
ncbi:trimethylamine methyltransferase family protein [Synergistes jonesii]|uniref:trimethylamine methyltransferase family protein n=1 Tax=Synergistes jonesii TaxID=2754 RepID=UPI00242BC7F5|nr:trimethylamine methyltransferase family protein [Synergistes jonesii]